MKPFYSLNFNARQCNMKVSVNGIPLLTMDVEGQCSSSYPFNNLILESGWATIQYEARPLASEMQLRKEAYLNCLVELFDMESPFDPVATLASYETPAQNEAILPYLIHEEAFQVNVPYSLKGWKQSTKLDHLDDKLRPMVFMKYNSIIGMMRNRNFTAYENAFREREDIVATCFYLSEAEKQGRMKEIENDITSSEIIPLSSTDRVELAADGHLVRLVKTDGESALRIKNEEAGEETMIELWLHMKPGSTELTII